MVIKKNIKKKVSSTQAQIPIRACTKGIIVTKDKRYIKIIETKAVPFFLKKVADQNAIHDAFMSLFKSGPIKMQIKSFSTKLNISTMLGSIKKDIENEKNENCLEIDRQFVDFLYETQHYSVSRRYFIILEYDKQRIKYKQNEFEVAVRWLNTTASRMAGILNSIGNECIEYDYEHQNNQNYEILYSIINRKKATNTTLDSHIENIVARYYEHYKKSDFYIPATDLIAPKRIYFNKSKYVEIDGIYYSYYGIFQNDYPDYVNIGWLSDFSNSFEGVDVDVHYEKKNTQDVLTDLRRNISQSTIDLEDSNSNQANAKKIADQYSSSVYLRDGIASGQDFYYTYTIITISGDSPDEVSYKANELQKTAIENNMKITEIKYQLEECFQATLPLCSISKGLKNKLQRNMLTESAASTYMFTAFQMLQDDGVYVAKNRETGAPIIFNLWNEDTFINPHIFICGSSGAGKTVTMMLLAIRFRLKHIPVFIIAPEKEDEYRRLTNALGGQFISYGPGSADRINIMDIMKVSEDVEKTLSNIDGKIANEKSKMLLHVATVLEFLCAYLTQISQVEKQRLNEAIIEAYNRKGITSNNESLWDDKEHTKYKQMPILSDVVNVLEENAENTNLATSLKYLTTGIGTHFDGQTNINIDSQFFVIGLETNSKETLNLSSFVAENFCQSKIREDRTSRSVFIIDEAWAQLSNPFTAAKLREDSKILRAFGCPLIIGTQQMSDTFKSNDGQDILKNSSTKIVMKLEPEDAVYVQDIIGITNSELKRIEGYKPGRGLFINGKNRISLQFDPSETEKLLTFTDKETLEKVKEMNIRKKQQEEIDKQKKEREKELSKYPDLNEMLVSTEKYIQNLNIVDLD